MLALLRKLWETHTHASIVVKTEHEAEELCTFLWTHQGDRFLPCATKADSHLAKQPFLFSTQDESHHNNAKVLFFTGSFLEEAKRVVEHHATQKASHQKNHIVVLHQEDKQSLSCFGEVFAMCHKKGLSMMMSHQSNGRWMQTQTPLWTTHNPTPPQ